MKLFLSLLIIICSLLGITDAGYMTYTQAMGIIPPCSPNFRCETVLTSSWSKIGPLHLSNLGVVFYVVFLIVGLIAYFDVNVIKLRRLQLPVPWLLAGWGTFGFLFSIYLITIMGLVINAWCFYCLLSALNCSILFILSWLLFRQLTKKET
jgi:uncharacterized membrane protein